MTFKRFTGNPEVPPLSANNLVSFDIDADEEIIGPHLPFPPPLCHFPLAFALALDAALAGAFAAQTKLSLSRMTFALRVAKRVNFGEIL